MIYRSISKNIPDPIDVYYIRTKRTSSNKIYAKISINDKKVTNDYVDIDSFNSLEETAKPMFSIDRFEEIFVDILHEETTPFDLDLFLIGLTQDKKLKVIPVSVRNIL